MQGLILESVAIAQLIWYFKLAIVSSRRVRECLLDSQFKIFATRNKSVKIQNPY
ncbi:hypothetical protein [Nostoc sp. DSM 114161]|uniref:hypothetical protein n=1 Tax=Nostoc sp. DSM 114161 TaxID=3440143 RepID=UPI0040459399